MIRQSNMLQYYFEIFVDIMEEVEPLLREQGYEVQWAEQTARTHLFLRRIRDKN